MAKPEKTPVVDEKEVTKKEKRKKLKVHKKHDESLEKSGLSLKRPLKEGNVSPLTNPAVRQSLLNAGGSIAADAQQEMNEAHDRVYPFISAKGELQNMTLQRISPPEMDGIRSSINTMVTNFDGFNQALFNDGILRPDNKRGRLGNEAMDIHSRLGALLTAEIDKQEEVVNKFNEWQQEQTKTVDVVEQLMQREIRERTHGLNERELLKLADDKPFIAKAFINDPLSTLTSAQQLRLMDKFLASIDEAQLDKRDTANKNIEWLTKAVEHYDAKLRGIYQTAEMTKLMEEIKLHGSIAGKVQRQNSGGGAITQSKQF